MISYSERIKIENGLRTRGKSYIREFVENGGPVDEVAFCIDINSIIVISCNNVGCDAVFEVCHC